MSAPEENRPEVNGRPTQKPTFMDLHAMGYVRVSQRTLWVTFMGNGMRVPS